MRFGKSSEREAAAWDAYHHGANGELVFLFPLPGSGCGDRRVATVSGTASCDEALVTITSWSPV